MRYRIFYVLFFLLFIIKPVFADKMIAMVAKNAPNVAISAGQSEKGDIIDILPIDHQFSESEKVSYDFILLDITPKEKDILLTDLIVEGTVDVYRPDIGQFVPMLQQWIDKARQFKIDTSLLKKVDFEKDINTQQVYTKLQVETVLTEKTKPNGTRTPTEIDSLDSRRLNFDSTMPR